MTAEDAQTDRENKPPAPPPFDWRQRQPPLEEPTIDNQTFFGGAPAGPRGPPPDIFDLPRDPAKFAAACFAFGLLAVLFSGADFFQQLVFVAPLFEEALKFGAALGIVTAFGLRSAPLRLVIALLPGAAFGALEHYLTYAEEEQAVYVFRIVFHSGTAALAMATWCAIEALPTWRHRWLTTVAGTLIHAINNAYALIAAILLTIDALLKGVPVEETKAPDELLVVPAILALTAHTLAWLVVYRQASVRNWVASRLRWRFFT